VVYEAAYGSLDGSGSHVHHLCGNKLCCRPSHLKAVDVHQHLSEEEHAAVNRDWAVEGYIRAEAEFKQKDFKGWRKDLIRRRHRYLKEQGIMS